MMPLLSDSPGPSAPLLPPQPSFSSFKHTLCLMTCINPGIVFMKEGRQHNITERDQWGVVRTPASVFSSTKCIQWSLLFTSVNPVLHGGRGLSSNALTQRRNTSFCPLLAAFSTNPGSSLIPWLQGVTGRG